MFDDPKSSVHSRQPVRVEKVDFRSTLGVQKSAPASLSPPSVSSEQKRASRRSPPSLDEITKRYNSPDHGVSEPAPTPRSPIALPLFLQKRKETAAQPTLVRIVVSSAEDEPAAIPGASRESAITCVPVETEEEEPFHQENIPSIILPDTASLSAEPEDDTSNCRTRTGRDMLAMLRRRTTGAFALRSASVDQLPSLSAGDNDRKLRRRSAPGHSSSRSCSEFSHPFLKLHGAF